MSSTDNLFHFNAGKKLPALVQLVEGEKDVINLDKVEDGMAAAISWLKQSFTTSVVTRMTPSELCVDDHYHMLPSLIVISINILLRNDNLCTC